MTIGQQLRAAREEQGMSIGDVARRTCIQPKFLHAIDDDNFGAMPESHRRLFVREYAKAVDLDPNGVLSQLPDYVPPPAPAPSPSIGTTTAFGGESSPSRGTLSISTSANSPSEHDRREYREILQRLSDGSGFSFARSNTALWLIVVACLLMVAGGLYYFIFRGEEPETAQTADGEVIDSTSVTAPIDGVAPVGDSATVTAAALGDSLTLEGRASGKVWYNMVMDGKRSETGTIDSGTSKSWRAAETFRVSLGNAGGLALTLNDKPIGTLGQRKTIVKNQVIDATGVVKKGTTRRTSASTRRSAPATRAITPTPLRTTDGSNGQ